MCCDSKDFNKNIQFLVTYIITDIDNTLSYSTYFPCLKRESACLRLMRSSFSGSELQCDRALSYSPNSSNIFHTFLSTQSL